MPKSAATVLGLVLIAASIGFNAWRYPITWRMTDPQMTLAVAGEKSRASEPSPAAQPAAPAPVEPERATPPPPTPATKTEVKPVSVPSDTPAPIPSPPIEAKPPVETKPVTETKPPIACQMASTSQDKTLVPVPRVAAAANLAKPPVAELRRLPPVDPNLPAPVAVTSAPIPIYPSTGK